MAIFFDIPYLFFFEMSELASEEENYSQGYLSTLAVEDLREYDALILATVILVIGFVLAVRCSRVLTRMQETDVHRKKSSLLRESAASGLIRDTTRRRYKPSITSEDDDEDYLDDLAAEEEAFLDEV